MGKLIQTEPKFRSGDRVVHTNTNNRGEVIALASGKFGVEALVVFDDTGRIWVPVKELELESLDSGNQHPCTRGR